MCPVQPGASICVLSNQEPLYASRPTSICVPSNQKPPYASCPTSVCVPSNQEPLYVSHPTGFLLPEILAFPLLQLREGGFASSPSRRTFQVSRTFVLLFGGHMQCSGPCALTVLRESTGPALISPFLGHVLAGLYSPL